MDSSSKTNEIIEKLIDENTVGTIENEYWEHIEYSENINTLIYCARVISTLVVIIIAIILLINKSKKKKINKMWLIILTIFIIITIVTLFVKGMPV